MKGRQIVLDQIGGREVAVLLVDGQLDDLLIEADAPAPGTVYRAVARRPLKGQGGLFLETPDGSAYLRGAKGIRPGQGLTVQVSGYAEPGKALPVTDRVLFKGRYAIVTPGAPGLNVSRQVRDEALRDDLLELAHSAMEGSKMGLILRSAASEAAPDDIAADIAAMRQAAEAVMADTGQAPERLLDGDGPRRLAWRDWTGPADVVDAPGALETLDLLDRIQALRGPRLDLPGGAVAWVEPTRALVAVDVDTGADASFAAALKANLGLARALPRALRLRGLGGQITLDIAPMAKRDRRGFETALRAAFKADPVDTVLAGWTPLGHYELQRKRARAPLANFLAK
ncbi:MAG: ribonuclease E/G [Rhodobacter sp.]|nr:ribonuclease E/G [Rhodobacter sp.]